MTSIYLASGLAVMAAAGHSYLSERIFLRPLRRETPAGGVLSEDAGRRLVVAMFHLASLCWAGMAVCMLLLEPATAGYAATLHVYAAIYAISGIGNFWAVGRLHPGGVVLLSASAMILVQLYA